MAGDFFPVVVSAPWPASWLAGAGRTYDDLVRDKLVRNVKEDYQELLV